MRRADASTSTLLRTGFVLDPDIVGTPVSALFRAAQSEPELDAGANAAIGRRDRAIRTPTAGTRIPRKNPTAPRKQETRKAPTVSRTNQYHCLLPSPFKLAYSTG